jgi:hypothetical protein
MDTADALDDANRTPLLNAVVAGLAALFAAALALGPPGGVPWERVLGQAAASATLTRSAVAATSGETTRPLAPVICFRGPRGEAVDFPAAHNCS